MHIIECEKTTRHVWIFIEVDHTFGELDMFKGSKKKETLQNVKHLEIYHFINKKIGCISIRQTRNHRWLA